MKAINFNGSHSLKIEEDDEDSDEDTVEEDQDIAESTERAFERIIEILLPND